MNFFKKLFQKQEKDDIHILDKLNKRLIKKPKDLEAREHKAYILSNDSEGIESALVIYIELAKDFPLNIEYTGKIWYLNHRLGYYNVADHYLERYYLRKNFSKDYIVVYANNLIKLKKYKKLPWVIKKMKKLDIEEDVINNIKNKLKNNE